MSGCNRFIFLQPLVRRFWLYGAMAVLAGKNCHPRQKAAVGGSPVSSFIKPLSHLFARPRFFEKGCPPKMAEFVFFSKTFPAFRINNEMD
jgi:hypothetical protein